MEGHIGDDGLEDESRDTDRKLKRPDIGMAACSLLDGTPDWMQKPVLKPGPTQNLTTEENEDGKSQ